MYIYIMCVIVGQNVDIFVKKIVYLMLFKKREKLFEINSVDFVDLNYQLNKIDIVCLIYIKMLYFDNKYVIEIFEFKG